MNKSELKKILKPIVKECIRESLYESGVLSSIISEVVQGVVTGTNNQVLEQQAPAPIQAPVVESKKTDEARTQQKLQELKIQKINFSMRLVRVHIMVSMCLREQNHSSLVVPPQQVQPQVATVTLTTQVSTLIL